MARSSHHHGRKLSGGLSLYGLAAAGRHSRADAVLLAQVYLRETGELALYDQRYTLVDCALCRRVFAEATVGEYARLTFARRYLAGNTADAERELERAEPYEAKPADFAV